MKQTKGKGMIFSLDAIFALILVITAVGIIIIYSQANETNAIAAQLKAIEASDDAIVNAYTGGTLKEGCGANDKICSCYSYYTYNVAADGKGPSQSITEKTTACGGTS